MPTRHILCLPTRNKKPPTCVINCKMKKNTHTSVRLHVISNPYSTSMAMGLALAFGLIHTGFMLLGNIYTEQQIVSDRFHTVALAIVNVLLFFFLFLINFRIMKSNRSTVHRFHLAVGSTVLITAGFTIFSQLALDSFLGYEMEHLVLIKDCLVAITVIVTTVVIYFVTRRQQTLLEIKQLQAENLQVRLQSLENQVDPHFLFNSLNTLDGLIGFDDDKAHQYLQQLASTYRYIMQQHHLVPLSEELSFAQNYVFLMQIRYGGSLHVNWCIDEQFLDRQIIPISLQTLLENAIKHNVVSDRHPLTITVESLPEGAIRVSNPRQVRDSADSQGIGLANLNNRYQLLTHQSISTTITTNLFVVDIPLV